MLLAFWAKDTKTYLKHDEDRVFVTTRVTNKLPVSGDEVPVPKNGVRPTFTGRPVIRQTEDDARIVFECKLVGDPLPEISW